MMEQIWQSNFSYSEHLYVLIVVVTFQECIVTIAYHKRKVYFDF
jgi:Fe2+ transport system protein B